MAKDPLKQHNSWKTPQGQLTEKDTPDQLQVGLVKVTDAEITQGGNLKLTFEANGKRFFIECNEIKE